MKSSVAMRLLLVLQVSVMLVCGAMKGHKNSNGLQRATPVNPKLGPDSHDHFFGKDYPDDKDASKHKKPNFGHPYPALQDTSDYEKDYVKDENRDDGEWKAQMTYDLLRTKIAKTDEEYKKAKQNEEDIRAQVETAQKNEANAEQATRDAETRAAKSKEVVDRAREAQRRLIDEGAAGGKEGDDEAKKAQAEVDTAMDTVKKEIKDLEGCRAELEAARQELKELLAKEEERKAEFNKAQTQVKLLANQNQKSAANTTLQQQTNKFKDGKTVDGWGKEQKITDEVEQRELQQGEVEAQAAVLEARAREFEAEGARQKAEQAELARKAADEEAKHREAQVQYEDQERDLQHTSHELGEAAAKLKAYRHDEEQSGSLRKPTGNMKAGAKPANLGSLPSLLTMSVLMMVILQ